MKRNYVYLFVEANDLELPMIVTDTLEEMSEMSGYNLKTLYSACERNSLINGKFRIRKVDVRDPEEKFDFEEYKKFCKDNNLKVSDFKNLQRFRQQSYGV